MMVTGVLQFDNRNGSHGRSTTDSSAGNLWFSLGARPVYCFTQVPGDRGRGRRRHRQGPGQRITAHRGARQAHHRAADPPGMDFWARPELRAVRDTAATWNDAVKGGPAARRSPGDNVGVDVRRAGARAGGEPAPGRLTAASRPPSAGSAIDLELDRRCRPPRRIERPGVDLAVIAAVVRDIDGQRAEVARRRRRHRRAVVIAELDRHAMRRAARERIPRHDQPRQRWRPLHRRIETRREHGPRGGGDAQRRTQKHEQRTHAPSLRTRHATRNCAGSLHRLSGSWPKLGRSSGSRTKPGQPGSRRDATVPPGTRAPARSAGGAARSAGEQRLEHPHGNDQQGDDHQPAMFAGTSRCAARERTAPAFRRDRLRSRRRGACPCPQAVHRAYHGRLLDQLGDRLGERVDRVRLGYEARTPRSRIAWTSSFIV